MKCLQRQLASCHGPISILRKGMYNVPFFEKITIIFWNSLLNSHYIPIKSHNGSWYQCIFYQLPQSKFLDRASRSPTSPEWSQVKDSMAPLRTDAGSSPFPQTREKGTWKPEYPKTPVWAGISLNYTELVIVTVTQKSVLGDPRTLIIPSLCISNLGGYR